MDRFRMRSEYTLTIDDLEKARDFARRSLIDIVDGTVMTGGRVELEGSATTPAEAIDSLLTEPLEVAKVITPFLLLGATPVDAGVTVSDITTTPV